MNTPKKTLKNTNSSHNNSLKKNKQNVSPLEYVQMNNPHLFATNMFSQNKVTSMSQTNLEKIKNDQHKKTHLKESYHLLINELIEKNILDKNEHKNIIDKILQVDRKYYCNKDEELCYSDFPMKSDDNQTLSAIHMYGYACALLKNKLVPGSNVLDVGCSSGMLTVIFANLVNVRGNMNKKRGKVVGIDIIPEFVESSKEKINNDTVNRDLLLPPNHDNFSIVSGNGKLGFPEKSKDKLYDVIHVGATNDTTYAPPYLKYQLKEGGIMCIPMKIDDEKQIIRLYQRKKGEIRFTDTELLVTFGTLIDSTDSKVINDNSKTKDK